MLGLLCYIVVGVVAVKSRGMIELRADTVERALGTRGFLIYVALQSCRPRFGFGDQPCAPELPLLRSPSDRDGSSGGSLPVPVQRTVRVGMSTLDKDPVPSLDMPPAGPFIGAQGGKVDRLAAPERTTRAAYCEGPVVGVDLKQPMSECRVAWARPSRTWTLKSRSIVEPQIQSMYFAAAFR